jgi:hypothetical protein
LACVDQHFGADAVGLENPGGLTLGDPQFGGNLEVLGGERVADPLAGRRIEPPRIGRVPWFTGEVGTAGSFGERHILGGFGPLRDPLPSPSVGRPVR